MEQGGNVIWEVGKDLLTSCSPPAPDDSADLIDVVLWRVRLL